MKTLKCALICSVVWSAGCAQILGVEDYEVKPDEKSDASAGSRDEADETTDETRDGTEDDAEPDATAPPDDTSERDASVSDEQATVDEDVDEATDESTDESTADDDETVTQDAGETDSDDPGDAGNTETPPDCEPGSGLTCDPLTQCGCEPGEACNFDNTLTGETQCGLPGNAEPYARCFDQFGDCPAGYGCVGGVCKEYCDANASALCGDGDYSACIQVTGNGLDVPGFNVCERTCDPVAPNTTSGPFNACGEGSGCIASESGVSSCIAAEPSGTQGVSCLDDYGANALMCAPGYACVDFGSEATCLRSCELGAEDCGAGSSCTPYSSEIYAADKPIGYCTSCSYPSISECDVHSQCGCAPGEMCAISDYATGQAACFPIGALELGETCSTTGECAPGLECLIWGATGSCTPFCRTTDDCPNANGVCLVWPGTNVGQCLQGCDPRDPTSTESPFFGCAEGQNCSIWFDYENGQCFEAESANEEGETCENEDECGPGLTCGGNGGLACARWCAVGADDCQPAEECLPDFYYRYSGDQDGGSIYLSSAGVEFGHCAAELAFETVEAETPIPDADADTGDFGTLASTLTLSGMDPQIRISMVRVTLNVTHEFLGDLSLKLVSPDGYEIILVGSLELEDASATSYENTVIDDTGSTPLALGAAPFNGTFSPMEPLWTLLGTSPNGTWQLVISDEANGDAGTLHSWSLSLF